MLEGYGQNGGHVHREGAKRDSMGYCSSPPSTSSSLHGLLFIHRRPPPASTCNYSSMGSCSSSLHRALLHRLLFNQPSTGYYSSSPPRGPVHPALHGVLFIHRLDRSGYCSSSGNGLYYHGGLFIQPPVGNCSSTLPTTLAVLPRFGPS